MNDYTWSFIGEQEENNAKQRHHKIMTDSCTEMSFQRKRSLALFATLRYFVVGYNFEQLSTTLNKCACRDAGLEYRGEHVFRHTFATNCYYKGMDIKILSKLLGHADVNITYNIYIHLYGDGVDEMYEALVGK